MTSFKAKGIQDYDFWLATSGTPVQLSQTEVNEEEKALLLLWHASDWGSKN